MLANTMYKARNIEGVLWFSDWGGSSIHTRALQILHNEQDTSLEKHAIFLNRPTSNSTQALNLAQKLKLSLAGNRGKNTGFHKREILGNHLRTDITPSGAIKTTLFGLSATGATLGLAGASPTLAGAVGVAGALYFVGATVKTGLKKFSGKKY